MPALLYSMFHSGQKKLMMMMMMMIISQSPYSASLAPFSFWLFNASVAAKNLPEHRLLGAPMHFLARICMYLDVFFSYLFMYPIQLSVNT